MSRQQRIVSFTGLQNCAWAICIALGVLYRGRHLRLAIHSPQKARMNWITSRLTSNVSAEPCKFAEAIDEVKDVTSYPNQPDAASGRAVLDITERTIKESLLHDMPSQARIAEGATTSLA
jgi:hypothetical protein